MAERVFLLPDPGEGLTEAEVMAWLVAEGDEVELNQAIAEVETAKAAVEIPSPFAGRVVRLHVAQGAVAQVGDPLVTFEVEGVAPAAVRTTPAVRKLARDLGVELQGVQGTGPEGRITADDIQGTGSEAVAVTAVRREIASNLERQSLIPQVTTFRTVDCTALEAFRAELGISPLTIVVAALARTVADHPLMNAAWGGTQIHVHATVNVGIAVDTDAGLMVPVVHDVGRKGIAETTQEIRRISEVARIGHLGPGESSGATIAVSNTGSYGSEAGTPLLSPGTAVTLAIGVIAPRALVVDGEVVARPACTLSLTFDHRVLDGATAGRALDDLIDLLQDPVRLRDLAP